MSLKHVLRPRRGELLVRWFVAVIMTCMAVLFWVIAVPNTGVAGPVVEIGGDAVRVLGQSRILQVGGGCTRLLRLEGRDVLVNTCSDCRNVQIVRSRSGGGLPEVRTFRVEPKNRFALPYKTAGSTRITSDEACAPQSADDRKNDRAVAEASAQCVLIAKVARGYVLLNRCPACRSTVVRWSYADGSEKNFPLVIDARKSVAVPNAGEVGVTVAHEEPCGG